MSRPRMLLVLGLAILATCGPTQTRAQDVVLTVDRDTGVVRFANNDPTVGDVALYEISSASGAMDASNWLPLANADSSWRVLGMPTNNRVTEIKETGSLQVSPASPVSLGAAFDPAPAKLAAGFAVDVEDLQVQIYNPVLDQLTAPAVVYTGEKIYNSLIVNVDALTGLAHIENESPFEVDLTGYTLGSVLGELNPSWSGIRSSDPTNWTQAGPISTNYASELNQNPNTAALTLTAGSTTDLGMLYMGDGTNQDLSFNFILQDSEAPLSSVVKYSNVGFAGDADNDGDVDGADFLMLQRIAAHQLPTWEANYGNGAALAVATISVPEPSALLLALLGFLIGSRSSTMRRHDYDSQNHCDPL